MMICVNLVDLVLHPAVLSLITKIGGKEAQISDNSRVIQGC